MLESAPVLVMWRLIHLLDGNLILFIEEDVNLWILGPGWRDGGHAPVWEVRQLTQLARILWISQDKTNHSFES